MNPRIVGAELDAAYVTLPIDGERQHEHARHVRSVGRKLKRRRQRDDEIGWAELPAAAPARRRRQVASIAFARAVRDPTLKSGDLRVAQRIQSDEPVAGRIDFPRRHDAISRDDRHLRGVRSRLRVRQQTERCRSPWMVALDALAEDDRRHVLREGHLPER